jgi:hypothetical protein
MALNPINEQLSTISKIAIRAGDEMGVRDRLSLMMDIEYVHQSNPLRLEDLLNADFGNFAHDISGIINNINRSSQTLDNCFTPRYSK